MKQMHLSKDYTSEIDKLKKDFYIKEGELNSLNATISNLEVEINEKKDKLEFLSKVILLFEKVSSEARIKAKESLEKIVTSSLKYIHGEDMEFRIELPETKKVAKAEFYIVINENGEEKLLDPIDNAAGGYLDAISIALRYAYIQALNYPALDSFIILDEPGKMVSELASVKFAEFIVNLNTLFDMQTIMISHNDSLKSIGDNNIHVTAKDNISNVINGGIIQNEQSKSENEQHIN